DTVLIEAARTLGAGTRTIMLEVIGPAALPSIIAGLRISSGLAWQSLIGAELIVGSTGLGFLIVQGESNLTTTVVIAGMCVIGVIGASLDTGLRMVEARITRSWRPG